MSTLAHSAPTQQKLGFGVAGAVVLHITVAGALLAATFLHPSSSKPFGDTSASVGAIQASMVSAIPLPSRAPAVDHSVLAAENVTKAPEPPPKEKTEPPPKPTDLLIKAKVDPKPAKIAAKETLDPPKHPQPTPETPKAASGSSATQIAQAITPVKNGTATATMQDRAFGNRYAWYAATVGRVVAQNWYTQEADPRSSQGKRVTLLFDIEHDGTVSNVRVETGSGSPTLDASAKHALQRVDGFGPLPAGDRQTVEYSFDYRQP